MSGTCESRDTERTAWAKEREQLLAMVAQQHRVAHTGLITSGLVHEIANYVMLISGSAFMASRSHDPRHWRETLDKIRTKCDEISQTMESVLAFTGRRGDDGLESFHAAEAIRHAARLLRPLVAADEVRLDYRITADSLLLGEQQLLTQALVNLGSNAVRACRDSGSAVEIHASRPEPETCRIEVIDNGGGIPENLRGRLFQPFTTSDASGSGHGLGLFIVRQAVRRMGGTIRVFTSPEGTRMRLEIPAAE